MVVPPATCPPITAPCFSHMLPLGQYHSNGPSPSLTGCLKAAQWRIKRQYNARAKKTLGTKFDTFWNEVCDWLKVRGNSASELATLVEMHPRESEAYRLLSVAIAFWVEAAISRDHLKNENRSWTALIQCNYYLGMACGSDAAHERSARGGSKQAEPFQQMRERVPVWLSEFPEGTFSSVSEAIRAIVPRATAFNPRKLPGEGKATHGRSTNPAALLSKWSGEDGDVRIAFERVVKGGIHRGRKKKPRIDRSAE